MAPPQSESVIPDLGLSKTLSTIDYKCEKKTENQ